MSEEQLDSNGNKKKRVRDGGLIRLPDYVLEKAKAVLQRNGIDLSKWPGVYLVGGVPSLLVQKSDVSLDHDLDFLVPRDWKDNKANPLRTWFAEHHAMIKSNEEEGYVALGQTEKHIMQFFGMDDLEETLEQFDLAPCRVAVGADGAFCTEDALYAFATGVCKNSCGSTERLDKYAQRGFDTKDLPPSIAGRVTWKKPDYSLMSRFHEALLVD